MLSNKEIICPNNLLDVAHKKKGVKAAVVNAGMPLPMLSVQDAVKEIDNATSPLANLVKTFEVTPPGAAAIIIKPTAIAEGRSRLSAMIKATIGNKIN